MTLTRRVSRKQSVKCQEDTNVTSVLAGIVHLFPTKKLGDIHGDQSTTSTTRHVKCVDSHGIFGATLVCTKA